MGCGCDKKDVAYYRPRRLKRKPKEKNNNEPLNPEFQTLAAGIRLNKMIRMTTNGKRVGIPPPGWNDLELDQWSELTLSQWSEMKL
jgi:hypothetical protein